jgi:hypothetical protein
MDPQVPITLESFRQIFINVAIAIPFTLVAMLPGLLLCWWLTRRDMRQIRQESEARHRQWALERQLRDMEQSIREERRQSRLRDPEITREARRRLGLPEEDAHD